MWSINIIKIKMNVRRVGNHFGRINMNNFWIEKWKSLFKEFDISRNKELFGIKII